MDRKYAGLRAVLFGVSIVGGVFMLVFGNYWVASVFVKPALHIPSPAFSNMSSIPFLFVDVDMTSMSLVPLLVWLEIVVGLVIFACIAIYLDARSD